MVSACRDAGRLWMSGAQSGASARRRYYPAARACRYSLTGRPAVEVEHAQPVAFHAPRTLMKSAWPVIPRGQESSVGSSLPPFFNRYPWPCGTTSRLPSMSRRSKLRRGIGCRGGPWVDTLQTCDGQRQHCRPRNSRRPMCTADRIFGRSPSQSGPWSWRPRSPCIRRAISRAGAGEVQEFAVGIVVGCGHDTALAVDFDDVACLAVAQIVVWQVQ